MEDFEVLFNSKGEDDVAFLICNTCNKTLSSWRGFVGILHVSITAVNNDIHMHACEGK